jgi:hypothetical protein
MFRSRILARGATSHNYLHTPQLQVRRIYTLEPAKLQAQDLLSLGSRYKKVTVHRPFPSLSSSSEAEEFQKPKSVVFQMQQQSSPVEVEAANAAGHGGVRKPFPDVQGFLYYVPGPAHAPIAGEVRFRVVPSGRPEGFARRGHDLLAHGRPVPWRIPLLTVLQSKTYAPLIPLIAAVSPETEEICRSPPADMLPTGPDATIVHSFKQPFWIDMQKAWAFVTFVEGTSVRKVLIAALREQRRNIPMCPYEGTVVHLLTHQPRRNAELELSGSMFCHLERGTGKYEEYAHLRVVKLVDAPRLAVAGYDGKLPSPQEGELLQTTRKNDIFKIKLTKIGNLYDPPSQDDDLDVTSER